MTTEIGITLGILVVAVVLFATEKLSADLVAILILGALLLTGLVTPEEGISGFSNPATITVAAMFVLSAALQKTGAVSALGQWLVRCGKNQTVLLVLIMAGAGVTSAFINNTAAVAVLLPLVIAAAAVHKISASKLLIPLSFASQFGGVCTLIGTSTNLLVNSIAERKGVATFSMFEFSRLGLIMVAAGTVYFLLLGRWLLPARRGEQLTETYSLGEYISELRVLEESPLIGKTAAEAELGRKSDVTLLEILREKERLWRPERERIQAGDVLLVRGPIKAILELQAPAKVKVEPEFKVQDEALTGEKAVLVEALVAPNSRLAGQTLADVNFRWRFDALVLAMRRRGHALRTKLAEVRLRSGDSLLLLLRKEDVPRLRANENFVVLQELDRIAVHRRRAPVALAIIALVVALAGMKVMPILIAAILGCAAMALTRCIKLEEAYEAIDWKVIVLLGGMLPLGIAMEKTGAAQLIADYTMQWVGAANPVLVLAALYLLTATLTECMSNNAAAVLLAPIAISTAVKLGADPKPFLLAVTFAASTSFATPVGYQTNTMVYNAGSYRFTDFMKVGIPLNIVFWVLAVYFIPKFWPF